MTMDSKTTDIRMTSGWYVRLGGDDATGWAYEVYSATDKLLANGGFWASRLEALRAGEDAHARAAR